MSLPSGVAAVRHSAKARSSRFPTGRPPVRAVTTRPGSRTSSIRASRNARSRTTGGLLETPPTRALSLGLTSRRRISDPSRPRSAARSSTDDATPASRRRVAAPTHHTAARRHRRTAEFASPNVRRLRAYVLRPGSRTGLDSPESDPRNSVPFVRSVLRSLPGRQRIRPRSHSKGSTVFIAVARLWEGCLDVDCFTPTPNQPSQFILSLTRSGRSSIPQLRSPCIFIDKAHCCL
jgi:hypothetical protein